MSSEIVRLLLIEDNDRDAMLQQATLAAYAPGEFVTTRASRLALALERLAAEHFDVVLSDLGLPDSIGLKTVDTLVSHASAMPLVVLTGSDDDALGRAAVLHGAQDFLVKGNANGALVARTLRHAIERKRFEIKLRYANEMLVVGVAERTASLEAALESVRESEERFRSVVTALSEGILSQDRDRAIRTWNDSAERILGLSAAQMQGRTAFDPSWQIVHENGSPFPIEMQLGSQVLLTGVPQSNVIMGIHKPNNSLTWISINAVPIFDPGDSSPSAVVVSFSDITERKATEAKIGRLSDLYAALSKCSQDIVRCADERELFLQVCRDVVMFGDMKMAWIGLLDEQGKQIKPMAAYGNGADLLNEITIYIDADEPFGCSPSSTAFRENKPIWCQNYQHDPATTPMHETSARLGWAASAALPLYCGGLVVGVFTLYAGEVNSFDHAVRTLLEEMAQIISFALDNFVREAARQQAEMRWQFAVESHGNAMWDWDADKDELFLTPAARELFYLPDIKSKRPFSDLMARVIDEDRALIQSQIDDIVAGKTSEWSGEYRLSCLGESLRWIATQGRVMTRTAEGLPHRLVSISSDITNRKYKDLEARRQRELVAHQARLVILGELASALVHEINQPLSAISGFASVCARKVAEIPEALELVRAIEEQAVRAGEIAWRMRGFARRQRLGRSPLFLQEVIARIAKWIHMDIDQINVIIDITGVDASLPQVDADRVELEQVLVNLVRNGIEASMPTDVTVMAPRIAIGGCLWEHPGEIEISVTDWGCGLPADKILDPSQAFKTSKPDGLGLGLSICFSIIEGHGGRLWATPNPEGGTIFHFTLPVVRPSMQSEENIVPVAI